MCFQSGGSLRIYSTVGMKRGYTENRQHYTASTVSIQILLVFLL